MTNEEILDALRAMLVDRDGVPRPAYSPEAMHWDAETLILSALDNCGQAEIAGAYRKLRDTPHVFWYA